MVSYLNKKNNIYKPAFYVEEMEKLEQREEGRYFLKGIEVTPELVYGPIMYKYQQIIDCAEIPIDALICQIKSETGVDLEQIANSYHSGGISITPSQKNNPEKRIRHEFIFFFDSKSKPCN